LRWEDPALALEIVEIWKASGDGSSDELIHRTNIAVRALLDHGAPDAAFEAFRESLGRLEAASASKGAQAELVAQTANQFMNRGQSVMAQSLFVRALALAPRDPNANLGLARAYRAIGDLRAAEDQYRKLLQIEPTNEAASRELERILAQELRR
jgi:tetratricopeptide (TPR) repeat protein